MHAELPRQVASLLADRRMIALEHRPEIADFLRGALLHGERARFDVPRIGGVEDRDDRRVVELGRLGVCHAQRCDARERGKRRGDEIAGSTMPSLHSRPPSG